MATTQLVAYSSSDVGGPGTLTGQAGTLIALLKACLVDGYSGHPSLGWTQPVATSGNIGSFKMNSGTGLGLVINDNGPNATSTYKEAWATGWESVAGVGSPVGSGSGQFPTPAQLLTSGHVVIQKSFSADSTPRSWMLFADASRFYLFTAHGSSAGVYGGFFFGDIFSLKTTADNYRCLIIGGSSENSFTTGTLNASVSISSSIAGNFMARSYGGGGASITVGKHGDTAKSGAVSPFDGAVQAPNGPDNAYYISPIWVHENVGLVIRGRMPGLYHICHPKATFADGQTIAGAGDYAGKTIQIIRDLYNTSSGLNHIGLEISATVETN